MKILYATLIALSLLTFSLAASAAEKCETLAYTSSVCQDYARGANKPLRSVKYKLDCLQLSQEQVGSVKLSLYKGEGGTTPVRSWQNVKNPRDQMCIPTSLRKKATVAIICGCKTKDNPDGRWQRLDLTNPAIVKAWQDGKILNLCRDS